MSNYRRDPRLDRFVTFAHEGQEAEMALLPSLLLDGEEVKAAVSTRYETERGLLAITQRRILMVYAAQSQPLKLSVPIERIIRTYPFAWYGAGNITLYTENEQYYFSLMSNEVYIPLCKVVERLAKAARGEQEAE